MPSAKSDVWCEPYSEVWLVEVSRCLLQQPEACAFDQMHRIWLLHVRLNAMLDTVLNNINLETKTKNFFKYPTCNPIPRHTYFHRYRYAHTVTTVDTASTSFSSSSSILNWTMMSDFKKSSWFETNNATTSSPSSPWHWQLSFPRKKHSL